MNVQELASQCAASINGARQFKIPMQDAVVSLVTPQGWKKPPKFPRGHLLQVKENGDRVWHFKAMNVLAWMVAKGLMALAPSADEDFKVKR